MDEHQHDLQPPVGRRTFLRRLGMTAAAAAALAGIADVAGRNPAGAAVRTRGGNQARGVGEVATLDSARLYCTPSPGHCGGGCQPSGVYCHQCTAVTGGIAGSNHTYNMCIGGDTNFTLRTDNPPSTPYLTCIPSPGQCGGGCQPSGVYCHRCTAVTVVPGGTGDYDYNMCIGRNDSFTLF
jgi:hypothetical protein